MRKRNESAEEIRGRILETCPDTIIALQELISDPNTAATAKVQMIGMILDRALGKTETPVKLTTNEESFEEAEAMLMEIVREIQVEKGMVPMLTETDAGDEDDIDVTFVDLAAGYIG